MSTETKTQRIVTPAPTEPGFYRYSGGRQSMIFLLTHPGQWMVFAASGMFDNCDWGYIEQALSVWDLVRIDDDPQWEKPREVTP